MSEFFPGEFLRYNPPNMLDKLKGILTSECKLDLEQPVLVGLSGGPDSLSLLDALDRLGYFVIAAHLNHQLRTESSAESIQVEKIAKSMGIPFFKSEVDVSEFAREHALSIEEAAREVRYDFLFNVAAKENAQCVAVGHNADDQVETVLMHFLRGSGLAGLRGMTYRTLPNAWSDRIPLVRPLLGFWRSEILQYCQERHLSPIIDQSNVDQTYFRNRLRHDLIPYLEGYNPKIKDVIFRTADILHEDYEIISENVDLAWDQCLHLHGPGYLGLKIDCLNEQRLGVLRYILRRAIAFHDPNLRDIEFKTIDHIIAFLKTPTRTLQRDLVSGLKLSIENNILWIAEWEASLPEGGWPAISSDMVFTLTLPGKISLGKDWEISAGIFPATEGIREQALTNQDHYQAWLDVRDLAPTLQIRSRFPGDRFHPHGMEGHSIKLSDFMINVKMPNRARDHWPLICSKDEIIWIPGFRIHHDYRITDKTQNVLFLRLQSSRHLKENNG